MLIGIVKIIAITGRFKYSANSYCDNNDNNSVCSVNSYCDNNWEVYMQC